MNNESENPETKTRFWPLIIALGIVISLWILSLLLIVRYLDGWQTRGTFGDTFGAVNSLFSGLAFAAIIYTIFLQRDELKLQREELKLQRMELADTRVELKRSADAQEKSGKALSLQIKSMKATAKLNALNSLVENYSREEEVWRKLNISKFNDARSKKDTFLAEIEKTLKQLEQEE